MSQTIINVPGKFKADEYGTSLADMSDIYDDVNNKPLSQTIADIKQDEKVQSDWNQTNTSAKDYIKNKPTSLPANGGNAATVNNHTVATDVPSGAVFTDTQGDWNVTDSSSLAYIRNKPTIPDISNLATKSELNSKVDKVAGKALSTNDYTNEDKQKVSNAITDVSDKASQSDLLAFETRVNGKLDEQDTKIEAYNGTDVIVVGDHTVVSNPDTQKIYREYGTNSYTDWMCTDATTTPPAWQDLATFSYPGVDNVPTVNSSKLVKSGGVAAAINEVKAEINGYEAELVGSDLPNVGYVYYDTGELTYNNTYKTSGFIKVKAGDEVTVTDYASSAVALVSAYSQENESSYIKSSSLQGANNGTMTVRGYTVPEGVNYIRISSTQGGGEDFSATIERDGLELKVSQLVLVSDVVKDNFSKPSYLLEKSRCSINFIFDDEKDADPDIKAVFDEFGLKCGFAIITSVQRYRGYAEEGFEILAHNDDESLSSATAQEIRNSMSEGKAAVEGLGLICHGWVTPGSELPSALTYITNDYFEYGFTVYKGESTTGQTMTNNMKSYDLWRCHMNTFKANYQSIIADALLNNGMISVYGHADEINDSWTLSELRTILQYCKSSGIEVLTPYRSCLKLFEDRHN